MSSQQLSKAFGRVMRQPTFIAAVVVLLVAAVGLNASVRFLKLHFKKEPVPLTRALTLVSDRFGPWVQVMPDKAIDKEIQDVLGTDQYIFREYVDERIAGVDVQQRFKNMLALEEKETDPKRRAELEDARKRALDQLRAKTPEAVVNLAVTYYTGMVDTVAHVPDRCFVADGYEPRPGEDTTVVWPIARDLAPASKPNGKDDVEVRYINFEDLTGSSQIKRSVAYFFHANGEFVSSPLGVRRKLQNLFERKGYYAKIEVMTLNINDPAKSAKVMTDFLSGALPDIYRSMPDWEKVTAAEKGAAVASADSRH